MTPLAQFDPLVRDWFTGKFATVTEPQRMGWPEIQAGRDVLISAPTGSGKTLAAFLTAIDSLDTDQRGGPEPTDITLENFGRPIPECLRHHFIGRLPAEAVTLRG